ncbi:MAG: ZIP family metal transporter [Planctomycetota bacterium]|nr:ZIP family metal transporter [Planctomycetota bacterium]
MPETAAGVSIGQALMVAAVALVGGVLPLLVRWNDRRLHAALALSTGIFLGAVFLHFLPELPHTSAGGLSERALWAFVLIGVLAVYLAETLFLHAHHEHEDPDQHHRAVGWAALFGLSVHSFTSGVGLAFAAQTPGLGQAVFVAILGHKGFEAFSLASVFQLGKFPRRATLAVVFGFALMTPLGALAGELMSGWLEGAGLAAAVALAAGSFLYVSLCELLPEVFHDRKDAVMKIALLLTGILVMNYFSEGHA